MFYSRHVPDGRQLPGQNYIGLRGMVLGRTHKIHKDIEPIPHLIFTGDQTLYQMWAK